MSRVVARKEAKAQGLKRYYTGKPCPHGHYSERFVSTGQCLECLRDHCREQYWADPEHGRWRAKQWAKNNPERARSRSRENYWSNPDHHRTTANEWKRRNQSYVREYKRWRYHSTAQGKLEVQCRNALQRTLKATGQSKEGYTETILGYSPNELRRHLERQFVKGMTWDNYGVAWHIDHVTPISVLVERGVTDPAKINALPNLQPVWKEYNLSKGGEVRQML